MFPNFPPTYQMPPISPSLVVVPPPPRASAIEALRNLARDRTQSTGEKRKALSALNPNVHQMNAVFLLDTHAFSTLFFLLKERGRQQALLTELLRNPNRIVTLLHHIAPVPKKGVFIPHFFSLLNEQQVQMLLQNWISRFSFDEILSVMCFVKSPSIHNTFFRAFFRTDDRAERMQFIQACNSDTFSYPLYHFMRHPKERQAMNHLVVTQYRAFSERVKENILLTAGESVFRALVQAQGFSPKELSEQVNCLFKRVETQAFRTDYLKSYLEKLCHEEALIDFFLELNTPLCYLIPCLCEENFGIFQKMDWFTRTALLQRAFPETKKEVHHMRLLYRPFKSRMEFLLETPIAIDKEVETFDTLLKKVDALLRSEITRETGQRICEMLPPLLFFYGMHFPPIKQRIFSLLLQLTEEQLKAVAPLMQKSDIDQLFPHPLFGLRVKQAEALLTFFPKKVRKYYFSKHHNWLQTEKKVCKQMRRNRGQNLEEAQQLLARFKRITSPNHLPLLRAQFGEKWLPFFSVDGYIRELESETIPKLQETLPDIEDQIGFFQKILPIDLPFLGLAGFEQLPQIGIESEEDFRALGLAVEMDKKAFLSKLKEYINQDEALFSFWEELKENAHIETASAFEKAHPGSLYQIRAVVKKKRKGSLKEQDGKKARD